MTEQKLQNYFKRFTAITPSAEFASRSRAQVVSAAQMPAIRLTWIMRFKETLTTGSALALSSLLLLIVLGGISYVSKQGGLTGGAVALNAASLSREASALSFNVQLKDAQYFDESASQVARVLDELSGSVQ